MTESVADRASMTAIADVHASSAFWSHAVELAPRDVNV